MVDTHSDPLLRLPTRVLEGILLYTTYRINCTLCTREVFYGNTIYTNEVVHDIVCHVCRDLYSKDVYKCTGCLQYTVEDNSIVTCTICQGQYHPLCDELVDMVLCNQHGLHRYTNIECEHECVDVETLNVCTRCEQTT